jgi:protein dithiol oxidoreductase (disulfide-forming)
MRFLTVLFAAFALFMAGSVAAADFQEGVHYTLVKSPQPVSVPKGKIEVIEFFWYGCGHCYSFEPTLNAWRKTLPADVVFRRVPLIPNPRWALGGKTYYTLEALGLVEKLHGEMFEAVQSGKISSESDVADWLSKRGVDRQKAVDIMEKDFSVHSKMSRAQQTGAAYGVTGVPNIAVGGRFMTSPTQVQSEKKALEVVDFLVAKIRAENKK